MFCRSSGGGGSCPRIQKCAAGVCAGDFVLRSTVAFLVLILLYTFTINCVTTGAQKMHIEYMFCFIF